MAEEKGKEITEEKAEAAPEEKADQAAVIVLDEGISIDGMIKQAGHYAKVMEACVKQTKEIMDHCVMRRVPGGGIIPEGAEVEVIKGRVQMALSLFQRITCRDSQREVADIFRSLANWYIQRDAQERQEQEERRLSFESSIVPAPPPLRDPAIQETRIVLNTMLDMLEEKAEETQEAASCEAEV